MKGGAVFNPRFSGEDEVCAPGMQGAGCEVGAD